MIVFFNNKNHYLRNSDTIKCHKSILIPFNKIYEKNQVEIVLSLSKNNSNVRDFFLSKSVYNINKLYKIMSIN